MRNHWLCSADKIALPVVYAPTATKLLICSIDVAGDLEERNLRVVEDISDEEFQRAAWFGLIPNVFSSPDELFCSLFDDFIFGDFLTSQQVNLTSRQRAAGQVLLTKMERFAASTSEQRDPRQVIDDERWSEIRLAARAFLDTLVS